MKQHVKVARIASWDGWCSPCERQDRPLVLTRSGPAGLLAWLTGHGDEDRCLLLTCRVCGQWQVVPRHEEDDPEVVLLEDAMVEAVAEIVAAPAPAPASASEILAAEAATETPAVQTHAAAAAQAPAAEAPAPVPVPRAASSVTLRGLLSGPPEVSAQTRAATAQVLAAARAAEAAPRTAPLDRSRRRQTGPAPRRPERSSTALRIPRPRADAAPPAPTSVTLPSQVLDLLASGHQVVLAPAR